MHERRQSLRRQVADAEQELPLLEQQRATAATDLELATGELTTARSSLQDSQVSLQSFNASFQTQQAEINQWQTALAEAEQRYRAAQNRLAQAEGQLSELRERLQELQGKAATAESDQEAQRLTAELAALSTHLGKLQAAADSAQQKANEQREKRGELQNQRQALINELKQLRREAASQSQALSQRQKVVARLEARVEMLDQMRHKETKTAPGVTVLGQFAQFLTIPPQYETAVSAALHDRLTTLLLPDETQLWRLVADQEGTLTAAALADLQPPPSPPLPKDDAVIGWAVDLVACQPEAQPLAQLLLGPVLLVQDGRSAYRLAQSLPAGAVAAAPDGFVAHAGGLVEVNGRSAQDNVLAREAEWRERKDELGRMKDELAALEGQFAEQNVRIQKMQEQVDELQNEERRLAQLENEAGQRVAQVQRDLDRARQQERYAQQQQENLAWQAETQQQELAQLQERIAQAEAGLAGLQEEVVAGETAVAHARQQLDALPVAEASQQRVTLQQSIAAAQTIVAGRQAVVDSRHTTLKQVEAQIQRLGQRLAALQAEQQQIDLADEDAARQKLQQHLDDLTAQLEPSRQALGGHRQEMRQLEEQMAAIQRRTLELETQYTQAQVKLSQEENHVEGLQERIKADLGIVALAYDEEQTGPTPLPISEVVDQLPTVAELPADIEETIHNYRGQMQRMGAINPDAPEEYEETQERYDFLTQQIEDLNETERQLREVIAELDELTSRAFRRNGGESK